MSPARLTVSAALIMALLAVALAFVPGQASVPPIDRDEPRYTQATKQMLETGDFVEIWFQDDPRHKKPIGIHWLQASAVTLSGAGTDAPLWVYRLPSLFGALAALGLAAWVARAFLPLGPALVVGGLVGATIILGVEARLAKTDAVLLATVLLALGALARVWLGARGFGTAMVFWLGLAGAILVKGPVGPMVIALTVLALGLLRGWSFLGRLRPVSGLLLTAAIALPWYVAIYLATDGAFYAAAVGQDFLGKAATGQEGHFAPPLTHLALFFVIAWPLAPFVAAALFRVFRERSPAVIFAAAWVIPSWIVFEAVPTKLPHYTLPMIPGVALAAVATLAAWDPGRWPRRIAATLLIAIPLAAAAAVVVLPAGLGMVTGVADLAQPAILAALAFATLAVLAAGSAARLILRGMSMLSPRVVVPALAAAAIAQGTAWGVVLPSLSPVWVSPRLVAAVEEVAPCTNPRIVSIGYFEPSFVFLSATDTALVHADAAPDAISNSQRCTVVASRANELADFRAAAEDAGMRLEAVGTVEGFNISKGDWLQLSLFVPSRIGDKDEAGLEAQGAAEVTGRPFEMIAETPALDRH